MSAPRKPSGALLVAVALVSAFLGLGLSGLVVRHMSRGGSPLQGLPTVADLRFTPTPPAQHLRSAGHHFAQGAMELACAAGLLQDWVINSRDHHLDRVLDALWQVESSGATKAPRGDGGRSRGPLQISRAYWLDSRIPGDWSDCEGIGYSRRVVAAYMRRYVPRAWAAANAEVIARTHCAGPDGARQDCSLPYWRKVRAVMEGVR